MADLHTILMLETSFLIIPSRREWHRSVIEPQWHGGDERGRVMGYILVADDDDNVVTLVEMALMGAGHRVVVARDGQQALDLLQAQRFDCAVLDVTMPRLSGHEVVHALRRNQATRGIPVLMLSALASTGQIDDGLSAGANDYLTKPFMVFELQRRVARLLDQAGQSTSTPRPRARSKRHHRFFALGKSA